MLHTKFSYHGYLLSFSNFIAAFGGGTILAKGMETINLAYLQSGAILAFFIGTVLGLSFISVIPNSLSKSFSKMFSVCSATTSLIMFVLFEAYSFNGKINGIIALLFFLLLSMRFGFWFYSRVIRASLVAGQQQEIAWIEFGYCSGMILGLIVWELLGLKSSFNYALLLDALFQFLAGILDFLGENQLPRLSFQANTTNSANEIKRTLNATWRWKLTAAAILLTIGVQVAIFYLAEHAPNHLGPMILAIFYLGAATAAAACRKLNISLNWNPITTKAIVNTNLQKKQLKLELIYIISLSGIFSGFAILKIADFIFNNISELNNIDTALLYLFIFSAAFFYEIIVLCILDRIGFEEQTNKESVIQAYGLIGMGAAISLWLLGAFNSSLLGLGMIMIACLVIATLTLLKRQDIA